MIRLLAILGIFAHLILAGCGSSKPEDMLASAKDYIAKKESSAAVIQIKNALQKNPDLAEARYLLGKILFENGDFATAELELRKALDLKYPANEVAPLLARAHLALGQFDKVIGGVSNPGVDSAEAKAELNASAAAAYFALGKRPQADAAVVAALALKLDQASALIIRARMAAAAGEFESALRDVESVTGKSPQNMEAQKLKGDVLAIMGRLDAAISAYRKAIEIRQDWAVPHAALFTLLIQTGKFEEAKLQLAEMKKVGPEHPLTIFNEALLAFASRDMKAAREKSQLLLRNFPENARALQLAGAIEFNLGSLVLAENYLAKAIRLDSDSVTARYWLARTHLAAGRPAKAAATLALVLPNIEKDSAKLFLAGEIYMQLGEISKGEENLLKASRLDPKDPGKRTSLALARYVKGDTENSLADLTQISLEDSGTVADMALVATSMRRRDYDRALKALDALDKKQPNNPQTAILRGRVLLAKGDLAGARLSFERVLTANPGFFPAAAALAGMDVRAGNLPAAQKRLEGVIAADPANSSALVSLADLKKRGKAPVEEISSLLIKAVSVAPSELEPRIALVSHYLVARNMTKAIATAQEALTAIPDSPDLLDLLGRAQMSAGESNQALATYSKLAAVQPNSPLADVRMADVYMTRNDATSAAQSLRKALAINPDLLTAHRGLIAMALQKNKPLDAIAVARDVQKQRPKEALGYLLEGEIGVSQKKWDDAINAYLSGLKQAPSSGILAMQLYDSLIAAGRQPESERFASEWLKKNPKDTVFSLHLGDFANARGDYSGAMIHYRRILPLLPDNPAFLNNIASAAGQLKQADAIDLAEKAVRLAPTEYAFLDTLGVLLAEKGETARALELLGTAAQGAPQFPGIRLNYARVLIQAGKKAEARKELEELAKLGEKFKAKADVAKLLKDI